MDWISLRARLPSDADLPARSSRLLAFEAVLDGRHYDDLPYPFSAERNGAGEYVPLDSRRPAVRTGLCRVVVEDAVSLLFSEGHFPALVGADARTIEALTALIRDVGLNETMLEAATRGSVGSVAIQFSIVAGRPSFDVLPTAYLQPGWSAVGPRRLQQVVQRFKVQGSVLAGQGYEVDPGATYWFTRCWDDLAETWFEPRRVGDDAIDRIDPVRTTRHALGFVPIVWVMNLPPDSPFDVDGACTFAPAIDTVIEIDYLLSQAGRGLKYGSDPTLVLKDGGSGFPNERVGGAATALVLPPEGDAKLLEINGNAAAAVLEHVRELRSIALESMHGNRATGDRVVAGQSGKAMELMCQGLIWLADRLRISYGEGALLSLLRMACLASQRVPGGIDIEGERVTGLDPRGLGLRWPPWFPPSFADRQAQANGLATLVGAGIVGRETASAIVADSFGIGSVDGRGELASNERNALELKGVGD